ncbi:MAG: extracellular solute-binding protein, partial [Chloroflexota bacterium]
MTITESEALAALHQGDITGLGTLVRLHQLCALRTAYAITGNQASAEDIVADAFVLVYERIAQYDLARPFTPWFFRIVANLALSLARRARHTLTGEAAEATLALQADSASGPEEEALRNSLRNLVVLAMQGLLPAQRGVLVQRYFLDMDEASMARMAGCPLGTIKSRLHTARRKLRERLAAHHPGVPADRATDRQMLRRLLLDYLEEAVPTASNVWTAVQQRIQLTISEDPLAKGVTTIPLPQDVAPPAPPDFSDPHPEGVYLLTGPPRSGPSVPLEEAERLAGFPILQFVGPEWQLLSTAYAPAEPRLAVGFDPHRYAWRMPAVILTYQRRTQAATVVEHVNPGLGQRIRFVQTSTGLPDDAVRRVEHIDNASYLVQYRQTDGLVTEVQFATPTTRAFVQFDPPIRWAAAAAFVQRLQSNARSIAMALSRRTFLSTASGLAVITVSGCSVPSLAHLPGVGTSSPPARVAGVRPGNVTNIAIKRLNDVLPTAVAALAAAKKPPIAPQIIWLTPPDTTSGSAGQTPTAGVVDTLDQMRRVSGATPRPDLVALGGSNVERSGGSNLLLSPDEVAQQLVGRKLLLPLDDFLRTTALVKVDDYFPGALEASRVDGKLYGLPLSIAPTMLIYDKQLFDEARVTVPAGGWDWQQMLEAARKLTKPPHQYAFAPTTLNVGMFIQLNGGDILSKDGRRCLLDQPMAIEAAAFYASLFHPSTIVAPQSNAPISFAQGVVTYQSASIAMLPNFVGVSAPVPPEGPRRLYFAEPFHGKVQRA